MKITVKEQLIFVESKATKNAEYAILIFGAPDFSGTINFLVNVNEVNVDFKERELVEVEFLMQLGNKRVGEDYLEIVTNRRIRSINKL